MNLLRVQERTPEYKEFHHGGEGDGRAIVLDFSVNVNPLGMSPLVKKAIAEQMEALGRYPDQQCRVVRGRLAEHLGVPAEAILCGNGASELVSLIVQAVRPRTALIPVPAFSGYERALLGIGARVWKYRLRREVGFMLTDEFLDVLRQRRPDIVFLCTPGNPVGNCIDRHLLEHIACCCEEQGTVLVVDECFMGFVPDGRSRSLHTLTGSRRSLLVLDAFTKVYALAGVRFGYVAAGNPALLARMRYLQPEWSVSAVAQIAGCAALDDTDYLHTGQRIIADEREYLAEELRLLGCTVYAGEANYLLCTAPVELYEPLLCRGILIRRCNTYDGLGERDYRIAIRAHHENERLVAAIQEVCRHA